MKNTKGIMNFEQPNDYHLISTYAKSDRSSYKKMRANKPDGALAQKALTQYLENAKYENNFPNKGYQEALDLIPAKK